MQQEEATQQQQYSYIAYDFSQPLEQMYQSKKGTYQPFCAPNPKQGQPNFVKNVKWSPDGLCLLSNSEDAKLRLFDVYATKSSFYIV